MIRVAIIEDDRRYRASLETLFSVAEGFTLVASFDDPRPACAALEGLQERPWDVVITDMQMPGMNGIEGTKRLKALFPELRVLMLTVYEDPPIILQAICAGADGYLLKRATVEDILAHVQATAQGGAPLTPAVASTLLEVLRGVQPKATSDLDLSERERQVLTGLVDGLSYKQIAAELHISIDTVRTHIRRLYRKLQVHSVAEAVSRAIREGLVV